MDRDITLFTAPQSLSSTTPSSSNTWTIPPEAQASINTILHNLTPQQNEEILRLHREGRGSEVGHVILDLMPPAQRQQMIDAATAALTQTPSQSLALGYKGQPGIVRQPFVLKQEHIYVAAAVYPIATVIKLLRKKSNIDSNIQVPWHVQPLANNAELIITQGLVSTYKKKNPTEGVKDAATVILVAYAKEAAAWGAKKIKS